MTEYIVDKLLLKGVKGRVVVLAGGATGIGAAAIGQFFDLGSHIYFGDWNETVGGELEEGLRARASISTGTVTFVKLDIRDYGSVLGLFETAYKIHGRIDIAICCAAVTETKGYCDPESLDLKNIRKMPSGILNVIDINLNGSIYFARIALAFLKEGYQFAKESEDRSMTKSIILVSSIAGFKESPGLYAYSAAKHGVLGLVRALRGPASSLYGIRVNAICPWATDTQLIDTIRDKWIEEKLPLNAPDDVASIIIQAGQDKSCIGRSIFVSGGKGYDIEEGLDRTEPDWLGKQNSEELAHGQEILGLGQDWGSPETAPKD